MKRYLLSIVQPDGAPPPPEVLGKIMENVHALEREARAAGAWVFSGGLHPANTATVVRAQGSEVLMTDGPFAEGKEHVGGIMIIQAEDLDAALQWAAKASRAITLPIEVRPFHHQSEA